jgi:hypothetical protein
MEQDADDAVAVQDGAGAGGYVFTRANQGVPHHPRQQRGEDGAKVEPHPAIVRGLELFRSSASDGAAAQTLFSRPDLHVSYAWFKSGFPLPLHSHDKDCYYLGKGDGVFIPNGAPYTVIPGEDGVEIIEMRTSPDYDTRYRAKSDAYWDRIAETQLASKERWANEKQPYGLIPTG